MNDSLDTLRQAVDAGLARAAASLALGTPADVKASRTLLADVARTLESARVAELSEMALVVRTHLAGPEDAASLGRAVEDVDTRWSDWKVGKTRATTAAPAADAPTLALEDDDAELEVLRSDMEIATMFITEAIEHLGSIEATVLQLEASPTDLKLLNDVFRPFHTIKGNAGALGVTSVQELAHKVENLLDLGRTGKHPIGAAEIEIILRSVDLLTTMINGVSARLGGGTAPDTQSERLSLMEDVDALVVVGIPLAAAVPDEPMHAAAPVTAAAEAAPQAALVMPAMPAAPSTAAAPEPAAAAPGAARAVKRDGDDAQAVVKVDTRKLDNLVDMVGELVIVQSIIHEDPTLMRVMDERLNRNLAQLKRITSDLQRNAMSMRMVPVRQVFQKMARLVRDLSRKSGKQVDLVLSGEDTELDRHVVEDIHDPLMHMVRNSLDHGIESPEVRRANGKSLPAKLSLSAYHQGGSIVIAIADDGAGLNTEKILAKAVAMGVVASGEALSDGDIHHLIFKPGFSTADKVTEISGRGVGMDVVRRNIESLRGRIEIQTELGRGTEFIIKLPLTLAIVEGLLLRVGGERFVLPTFCVRESLKPSVDQIHSVGGRPRMIQVRDTLLPLVRLSDLFFVSGAKADAAEATVVVIEEDARQVALLVDELLGKQEVVIKSLGEAMANVNGVAGGAILGDGRIGLILDAGGLMKLMGDSGMRAA